jgi:UDPglucose 6-dehydrogenase
MTAGMGDGGACHPRDNIALRYMAEQLDLGYDLFAAIMDAREIQARNLAKELVYWAEKTKMPIYIHGKAYKPKVPYCDGSYSLLVGFYCKEMGHYPVYIDPLTGDTVTGKVKGVTLLAHSASTTYKYTEQHNRDDLYCEFEEGTIFIDPWRKMNNMDGYTVIHYGNTRQINR